MNHAQKMIKARSAVPAEIEANNEAGQAARQHMGQEAYSLNVQQFCCAGLNFGYFYEKSPIIAFDEETAPAYTMGDFTASTVPGCRAPHFWLNDGRSLYDELGPAYTLMVLDASAQVKPLLEAAQQAQVPLKVLNLSEQSEVPPAYKHKLLICRTDQHVVWRGDDCTQAAVQLMRQLKGLSEKALA